MEPKCQFIAYKKLLKHRAKGGCAESGDILKSWHWLDSLGRPRVPRFRKRHPMRQVAAFAPMTVLASGDQLLFEVFKLIGSARRAYKGWHPAYCELTPDFINDRIRILVFIQKRPPYEIRIGGLRPNFPIVTSQTLNYPVPERTLPCKPTPDYSIPKCDYDPKFKVFGLNPIK